MAIRQVEAKNTGFGFVVEYKVILVRFMCGKCHECFYVERKPEGKAVCDVVSCPFGCSQKEEKEENPL